MSDTVNQVNTQVDTQEAPITDWTWEILLAQRERVDYLLENLQAERKVINDEILIRLNAEGVNGKIFDNAAISIGRRFSVIIPKKKEEKEKVMDALRELGLLKTVEKPDSDMIQSAIERGVELPCEVSTTQYPIVKEVVHLDD